MTRFPGVRAFVIAAKVAGLLLAAAPATAQDAITPDAKPAVAAEAHPAGTTDAKPTDFSALDALIQKAIADGELPGVVMLVGHNGQVVYRKAFGERSLEPRRERMTLDTIFDMASVTKCMATAIAVMQLVEQGKVRLNDPVVRYLPGFAAHDKDEITVRQLFTHFSGLEEDLDLKSHWEGKATAYHMAFEETPIYPAGARFLYSDIDFVVLGALVEEVSHQSLDQYATQHIYEPLGMKETRFLPPASWKARIAPTEYDEHRVMLRGVVHDPTARRMGGVAGHAGLFSTADDVAKFAEALLRGGSPILSPLSVEKMTTPQQPPAARVARGLGWDLDSPFASNRGEFFPVGSYGHTGFTGTSLWIDPVTDTYIILLSNAVHPKREKSIVSLRSRVASVVAAALHLDPSQADKMRLAQITGYNETATARRVPARNAVVKTGIDVLEEHAFKELRGSDEHPRKIGLVTNQTGVDALGRRTIDVLAHAPGIELAAIFSPEHGVEGTLDTTQTGNTVDAATKVPVYSVYGSSDAARRPPLDVLKKLDAVVFDIQDAGVRFYTYETTLGYFLEAASRADVPVFVLDRPNPITGAYVQGPVSDNGKQNFTNYRPEPVRHGLTMGELARMFNGEEKLGARLTVVPMDGWMRGDWFDSTGLAWVNPSPNLRNLSQATLYPGVAMVEGTNVSVGRGTDTPFELLGAPWVDARQLAAYLNGRMIQGVRFVPTTFTPASGIYQNQACGGVNIVLLSRDFFDAPELGVELASALRKLYPTQWKLEKIQDLLVNQAVYDALAAGQDPRRISEDWREQLEKFEVVRKKYLLY